MIAGIEAMFGAIPPSLLEIWGRTAYVIGFLLAIWAFGGLTWRPRATPLIGRERQVWDVPAVLSVLTTFVLVIASGYLGSFIVLVPGAQTFESLKDLIVFLCVVLFGYPALITVPFAYGLSDLIEGVPPEFLLEWLPGYFINASFFWIAWKFIGRSPDFRRGRTWAKYAAFVVIFMALEPVLWGHICAGRFTPAISYRNITSALFFTTGITWMLAPFALLAAFPVARTLGLFWAEIPGRDEARPAAMWPIRMVILLPFMLLALALIGVTAYVTLRSAEADAQRLAARLHDEISENLKFRLEDYLEQTPADAVGEAGLTALLRSAPIATHGIALVVDGSGKVIATSADPGNAVAGRAVAELDTRWPRRSGPDGSIQFEFDNITEKPLARTTWLARASAYDDRARGDRGWVVLTVMQEGYYLAGVNTGSRRSAMVFSLAVTLFLLAGAILAAKVTGGLRRTVRATEALAQGDLAVRLPDSRLEEVSTLARAFNDMAARLARSIADLRSEVDTRKRRESELEQSEVRTRTSESRLQLALEAGSLATWDWNIERDKLSWDDAMYRLYGVDRGAFKGTYEAWAASIVAEDRDRARSDVETAVATGGDLSTEFRVQMPDGQIRVIRGVGRTILNPHGHAIRMVGINSDITERRRMEGLMEAESRVLAMIASGGAVEDVLRATVTSIEALLPGTIASILLLDADGVHLRLGAAPNLPEAYSRAIESGEIGPKAGSCGTAAWRRQMVIVDDIERDPLWEDYRALAQTYGLRACWSTPILDPNNAVLGTFALYYRSPRMPARADIELIGRAARLAGLAIERGRASDALRANERRLMEEKRFVDTLMDSLPGVVFLFDTSGRFRQWNKVVEEITGYSARELETLTPLELMDPADVESVAAAISRVPDRGQDEVEARLLTRDRRSIPYYFKITRLATDQGIRTLGIGIDISERRSLEEQFRQAQKMEAVGHLAAGVAHDFNNLLTIISGYSQLLDAESRESSFDREAIAAIRDAGDRAASLTRQLLAFSRKTVLQPKVLDINVEVRDTEKMLRRVIGEDVRLTTAFDLSAGRIQVDPGQLSQALMNLSVNARDAMPRGGTLTLTTRRVRVSEEEAARVSDDLRAGDYAVLSVSDTGTGMPPDVRARIFEPFFTTKGVGKGTGLGLAMVYGFVKQSGGHIDVRSTVGQGTSFDLYFPSAAEQMATHPAEVGDGHGSRGTETVLLVEDDPGVRMLSMRALKAQGYRLLVGVDGDDALRVSAEHAGAIDIVVTDVVMPGLSGRELADALRARHPGLRVLYVSGYTDDAVVRHGLMHDQIAFLPKPYDHVTLARKVREVLDGAPATDVRPS
jgi:PAS domain S-box-containing protein